MKQIKKEFTRQGYVHKLMERSRWCVIYVVKDKIGCRHHYEVLHVLRHAKTQTTKFGTTVEGDEYLPSQSRWGEQAWTVMRLNDALDLYETETNRLSMKAKTEAA